MPTPKKLDGGVVKESRCFICGRDRRILTKHVVTSQNLLVWSCADTESCMEIIGGLNGITASEVRRRIADGEV